MAKHDVPEYGSDQNRNLVQEVEERLRDGDLEGLKALLEQVPAADVADVLENVDAGELARAFRLLDSATAGAVLGEIGLLSVSSLADSSPKSLVEAVEEMEPDEVANVLDVLSDEQRDSVLRSMSEEEAHEVRGLLEHPADTAGGMMTPEFMVLSGGMSASNAIEITQRSRESETIAHLFVCGDGDRLLGYLPLHRLVFAHPERKLGELMETEVVTVHPETDREEVVRLATRYDLDVVAVVNEQEKLVGVVTVDDILEAAQEEANEDMYRLAGTAERDPVHASVLRSTRLRLPWLLLTLGGGMVIALLVSRFAGTLETVQKLAFFIPLIPLMGGNVAIQASTIVVRGLAVGDIHRGRLGAFVVKQWAVAALLALLCGIVAGLSGGMMPGISPPLALVVGVAIALAIMVAGTLGTLIPLAFHRVGIDPAVSAGPFVTILNDLTCISIYLSLGTVFTSALR